ncbi:unnamed protein product [Nippostrongylus brasiliensis]|uniref:G_PROTEIN_RECEP_F1_2 domain-containing protein n=1 Tax=Nippostrongylus brasiliensis TaxID=27835 RepID=A0A0N4YLF0_NIPBR|nr:unnamed protein product [Nippostrongylus brasiliensis]
MYLPLQVLLVISYTTYDSSQAQSFPKGQPMQFIDTHSDVNKNDIILKLSTNKASLWCSWSADIREPDGLSATFAMGMISFLIVDIVILILQAASIIFNALPYIIYLTAQWNPTYIDLDPTYIMISSTPLTAQLKINLTLTIALALERCLYAVTALTVGCLLAALDLTIEFMLAPFKRVPNCAAIGCFVSDQFRYYWGTSNMVMGIIVVVLTLLLMGKLQLIQRHSRVGQHRAERDTSRFRTVRVQPQKQIFRKYYR